jgi:hypothetical protein
VAKLYESKTLDFTYDSLPNASFFIRYMTIWNSILIIDMEEDAPV